MADSQDAPFWASSIVGHNQRQIDFHHRRFLFARTRTALSSVHMGISNAMHNFIQACRDLRLESIMLLNMQKDQQDWNNGFAISFEAWNSPGHIAHDLSDGLMGFDAWAIHNGRGGFEESADIGFGRYFKNTEAGTNGDPRFAQLFVTFRSNDKDISATIGKIKNRLGRRCFPVFHLSNGQILFIDSNESGVDIVRSCRSELRSLSCWCVCDSRGSSWSSDGRNDDVWTWRDLSLFDSNR